MASMSNTSPAKNKRVEMEMAEGNAATGHEFVAKGALARHLITVVGECFYQSVQVFLAQFVATTVGLQSQFV